MYIIVLDDKDLEKLANFRLNDDNDDNINDFVASKINGIID